MNWDDYRFLIAVIEAGSLNGAAQRLRVNHATVLRRISGFEDRLGVTLFERHRTGYRLIAARQELGLRLETVRDAIDAAERVVRGEAKSLRGAVKITSTDSLCEAILPAILAGLQRNYPDLRLELLSTNSRLNLAQMDAEIMVRPAVSIPDDLAGEQVGKLRFRIYGASAYVRSIRGTDPAGFRWLGTSALLAKSPAGIWLAENTQPAQWVFHADSFVSLRNLAQTGMGLAILPCCLVAPHHGLEVLEQTDIPLQIPVWVANHRDFDSMPHIRACKDYLLAELAKCGDLLAGTRHRRSSAQNPAI